MLMHTKGILVMTPDSAMVLTGKQSLDFSGGVSAEDNFGIGGYDRVMGPNGQAQYWAPDLAGACEVLMAHYDHTYVAPGESRSAAGGDLRPGGPRRHVVPARAGRQRLPHGRRHLLPGHQPRPQEAVRHPHADARRLRPGPPASSSAGPAWPTPTPRSSRTPTSAATRSACSGSSRGRAAAGLPAHRRPRHLDRGHAVPAVVEEGGAGDQRRERQPAAGRAGEPLRLRRVTGLDAQPAAGVRRRDRPGDRELRRARSSSASSRATTAARSWCSPRRSTRG